jgi:DNA helicase II / ATP-dependent DNA helicase PcrA
LVDEFQDTSQTQMDLIKLLTSSSLFVVGDADQSIYSWRGAHAGSLSDFASEFHAYSGEQGVSTVYLMENYRCVYMHAVAIAIDSANMICVSLE